MEPQTRRLALPNRIRYPTDCLFASSCSPPHFAMTQLLSATTLWHTPTGTFTLLISCPCGRTIAARIGLERLSSRNSSANSTWRMAHKPVCSIPTERGRTSSRVLTSTACISVGGTVSRFSFCFRLGFRLRWSRRRRNSRCLVQLQLCDNPIGFHGGGFRQVNFYQAGLTGQQFVNTNAQGRPE